MNQPAKSENQLPETPEFMWALFESVPDAMSLLVKGVKDYAIFMLDLQGNVVTWNEGAETIKGYQTKEIIGHHFSCFYTDKDVQSGKPDDELKQALIAGHFQDEGLRKRKDGSTLSVTILLSEMARVINAMASRVSPVRGGSP